MRYLSIISFLFLFACGNEPATGTDSTAADTAATTDLVDTTAADAPSDASPETPPAPTDEFDAFLGSYVGYFEAKARKEGAKDISWSNKITVFIDKITGDTVHGHSVVAGNERPFVGTISVHGDPQDFAILEVREPGDNRYDGTFLMEIKSDKAILTGTWEAYGDLPVYEREFTLEKRTFNHDPNRMLVQEPDDWNWGELYNTYLEETFEGEYVTPDANAYNASTEQLTPAMVENMYKGDLEVMRNAIYARHGYSFKNRRMRYFFDQHVDWYMPVSTDIRAQLTPLEKANIDLLKRYEAHATAYYDSFGR